MKNLKYLLIILICSYFSLLNAAQEVTNPTIQKKTIAYIVSDRRIPFWDIMAKGIENKTNTLGYELKVYSSENLAKKELEFTIKAIKDRVSGIVISPTNSSACVTILKLAKAASVPVVISDIGTDAGEYVSFISSNNKEGAYDIGKVLTKKMIELGWNDGKVGIIAIPQKRINGQLRTAGFMQALHESNIKTSGITQQITFSYQETYDYARQLIKDDPKLKAIWLQGSDRYQGALDAINDAGKKGEILLLTFDAEPIFLDLIPKGILLGSAMQQPYLMGQEAVVQMNNHLKGKEVNKNIQLPILAVSTKNISQKLSIIKTNVLGIESK